MIGDFLAQVRRGQDRGLHLAVGGVQLDLRQPDAEILAGLVAEPRRVDLDASGDLRKEAHLAAERDREAARK